MIRQKYGTAINACNYFITLDIGGRKDEGTAAALFIKKQNKPTYTKSFFSSLDNWEFRVSHICLAFQNWLIELQRSQILIFLEKPEFWESHKGMTAARSESLFKLIFLYGRLYEVCVQCKANPVGITAKEWKGQLPKDIMHRRINRILEENYKGDIADAVGIGLYLKGLL